LNTRPVRIGAAASLLAGLALVGFARGTAAGKGVVPAKRPKATSGAVGKLSLADHQCNHFGSLSCPTSGSAGELSTADCRLDDGSYLDLVQFAGIAGQTVTIDMTSAAFDTYLYLLDPTPVAVASNDDVTGSTNSRIVFTLTRSGTWTIGATSLGANQFGAYSLAIQCASAPATTPTPTPPVTPTPTQPTPSSQPAAIIPVVGSTPGAVGQSFFRTSVQLLNPGTTRMTGRLVHHPAGSSAAATDPALNYVLEPGETRSIADLLPAMGLTGLGSLDVFPDTSTATPLFVVRVFNDGGAAGTTGFTEEAVRPADALLAGERGFLIAPPDAVLYRFNVGVRTLESGATLTITARNAAGTVTRTLTRTYPPNYFEQRDSASFLNGAPVAANESITIQIVSGSAIVYGATVDNRTNDPSLQLATRTP
jgi:pre-peptidase